MLKCDQCACNSRTCCIFYFIGNLKVAGNEKEGRSGRWQSFGIGLGPFEVCLLFNFTIFFNSIHFRFRQVKQKLKVVGNEKEGGSRQWQMIGIGLIIILLLSLI